MDSLKQGILIKIPDNMQTKRNLLKKEAAPPGGRKKGRGRTRTLSSSRQPQKRTNVRMGSQGDSVTDIPSSGVSKGRKVKTKGENKRIVEKKGGKRRTI